MNNENIKQFVVGQIYSCRSICNYDCQWSFEILRRSAKSVWVEVDGKVSRRSLSAWNGAEFFKPFGSYSMSPSVYADHLNA